MKNIIGEKFITNEGYLVEVIAYKTCLNIEIKFEDGHVVRVSYSSLKKGSIKNYNHPSVFNIGFIGIGRYKVKINGKLSKSYTTWNHMLQRCYSKKYQEKQPTYIGCSVAKEWHNYQNFSKWFEDNYIEGYALDKDIIIKDNKVYSPDTCCFVPQEVNNLFTKRKSHRGEYLIGVYFDKRINKFKAVCNVNGESKYLGVFCSEIEAFESYKIVKEQTAKKTGFRL
jgi:hypothetical protein